ncbi:MAG TPA: hypothetical protein VMU43_00945 [Candidatus Acidoferrum sp.]|nr:hypothetical protein [Candidatus Acidoferrum sp.]
MIQIDKHPFVVLLASFFVMWLSMWIGTSMREKQSDLDEEARKDIDVIVAATLTLLGLIIGFSFSMAINRYDQRKVYEEAEANAIGTEYVRADLLPAADAANVQEDLKKYLDQRILFYTTRNERKVEQIDEDTSRLQTELWSAVRMPALAQPTPVAALVVSGMNDVLNSQGYTQAAWWNGIPFGAWALMIAIAICSNLLVGYARRRVGKGVMRHLLLPIVLSIAFAFIADIDSPRWGTIVVHPQNLISLRQSLPSQ